MGRPTLPFRSRAYELRANVTAYDAAYIGLAEALSCELVTAPGPRCRIRIIES